jgi:tetratricopeptide (TPR) repeat protein
MKSANGFEVVVQAQALIRKHVGVLTLVGGMTGLSLLLAPAANAQTSAPAGGKARYTKREVDVVGVPQTELTKPQAPSKEVRRGSGPMLTVEEFRGQRQEKIVKINQIAIEKHQRLLRVTDDDDPQKPEFHFRLAELYYEQQRYTNFQARSLDERVFQAKNPGEKARLEQQQKRLEGEERQWLLKAVESYVAASQFRKYEKMDEVLFRLAYLLQTIKKEEQAREFFLRLIKDYPNSKYVPDAYLSFAQYFFDKGEMDAAKKFYEKVEQFPKSSVYGYAVYKKGWCFINLGDFRTALQTFVDVIRLAQAGKAGGNKLANQALEREAKKDVVKAYARTPGAGPDKAWEFFNRTGGDFAPKMMEALAELYWEQGMFGDSTKVYHKMMVLNPESPRLCEWQNKVVRNTLSAGTKRDQVQEVNRLGIAYDRVKAQPAAKKDLVEECRNAFHDISKELALVWHKEAQRTKNPDTYVLVRYVYKDYLDRFSKEKGALDMGFYYAEVLWTTQQWREAAEQYTKVVELDPRGRWVKEAAYAAVLSWKNALNIDDTGQGPDKQGNNTKEFKQQPIPEYQKKMIAAFDTYIKYVPDAPELVTIKYRKARIYYDYNHFDQAAALFQDIVDKHSEHELAEYSANLLLDSLNIQGEHLKMPGKTREALRMVDKFMDTPALMKNPEFAKNMVNLKVDGLVIEAKQYEDRGNYKECGRSMLAAAESMPDHPKHAERLYDSAVCFQNARLVGRAVAVRNELIRTHPNDPLAQKALFKVASGYHQIAFYSEAAQRYEQFASKFPGEKESADALNNAYKFRVGMREYDQAIKDLNDYIRLYGARKPREAADVFFQMGEVYEKENRVNDHIRHLENYLKQWGSKGSIEKQLLAHFKLGEYYWKKSCSQEGVNGACIKIERVSATGRQRAFYEINKRITDKKKKIKEKERTQCGPPTKSKITVLDRTRNFAATAQKHFTDALRLYDNGAAVRRLPAGPDRQSRAVLAQHAAAGSLFYQGEKVYEDFLRLRFPDGLQLQRPNNFDSPRKAAAKKKRFEEDVKKLTKYITEKGTLAARLAGPTTDKKGIYDKVLDYKVAHWTIAGSARIGQIWANFVDQLYTAPIPKELKSKNEWGMNERELFCDELVDKAEPIEAKAVQGYEFCLKAATQESWFNEWSAMCEVEMNQMQPSEYPLAVEARPEAGYSSSLFTPAKVIPELTSSPTTVAAAPQGQTQASGN